jgi:hypothetical protein
MDLMGALGKGLSGSGTPQRLATLRWPIERHGEPARTFGRPATLFG